MFDTEKGPNHFRLQVLSVLGRFAVNKLPTSWVRHSETGVRCFTTQLSTSLMVQHRTPDLSMASGIYWLNFNLGWSPQDALSSCESAFPQGGWKSGSTKTARSLWVGITLHEHRRPTFKNRNQVPYKTNTSLMLSQLIHQCINLVTQLPHRLSKTKRSWGYWNFAKKNPDFCHIFFNQSLITPLPCVFVLVPFLGDVFSSKKGHGSEIRFFLCRQSL